MKQIDSSYLLNLLEVSEIFSEAEKFSIKNSLIRIPAIKLTKLQKLLEEEQCKMTEFYEKATLLNKEFTEIKIKTIYEHAEKKVRDEEAKMLIDLDAELVMITD